MERIVASSITLFLFFMISLCLGQTPIPAKYDGFLYGKNTPRAWGDSVIVEAFLDPMCPHSRGSWPPLKKAFSYYFPHVTLIVHPFPLPYHSNSYSACRALHIANKLNSSSTYPLLELFFKYREIYYDAPTINMSRSSIMDDFSKLAVLVVGNTTESAFLSGFSDPLTDVASRFSFKHGCSRGVAGTPYFFVNGIPLPDYESALTFQQWRSIIDPLFAKQ